MFENFKTGFACERYGTPLSDNVTLQNSCLAEFFRQFSGCSFERGLYRAVDVNTHRLATEFVREAFPAYSPHVSPFAYDWAGNVFAASQTNPTANIFMFEPGTGQSMEAPFDILSFHDVALVGDRTGALGAELFESWYSRVRKPLAYTDCIGYKKPLFLGGEDDEANLEVSDVDVYWTLLGQLISKTRGLKSGTAVGNINITD